MKTRRGELCKINNQFAFFSSGHKRDIAEILSEALGMNDDGEVAGIVVNLNTPYYGYLEESIWQWIEKQENEL